MPLRASTSILLTRGARRRAGRGRGRGRGPYSVAVAPWVSGVKRQSTSNPISHRRSCVPTQHSTARGGRRQSSAVKSSEKMRGEKKKPTAVSRFTSAGAPDSAGRAKGRGQDRRAGTARLGWLLLRLHGSIRRRLHRSETRRRPSTSSRRPARPPAATARRA
jgi:hypothetical protein